MPKRAGQSFDLVVAAVTIVYGSYMYVQNKQYYKRKEKIVKHKPKVQR